MNLHELDIEGLSVPERLELISRLWDSIPESSQVLAVPDWHHQELQRRLAAADADPQAAIPSNELPWSSPGDMVGR